MKPEEAAELAAMVQVLGEAGYMDWSRKAADLRLEKAKALTHLGLDHMMLAVLWRQAQREASKNACGLFACWMNERVRLLAAVERLRQRNAFANQAVKDVQRDQRRTAAEREAEMQANIRSLADFKKRNA